MSDSAESCNLQMPLCYLRISKAAELGAFVMQLVQEGLWSMAHAMYCYPASFAMLLHIDETQVSNALDRMKLHWEMWQAVQANTTTMFKNMLKRSCFSLSFVKLVFHELARAAFQAVPATLSVLLTCVFRADQDRGRCLPEDAEC